MNGIVYTGEGLAVVVASAGLALAALVTGALALKLGFTLSLAAVVACRGRDGRLWRPVVAAFVMSAAGDACLSLSTTVNSQGTSQQDPMLFAAGVAAYWMAHAAYVVQALRLRSHLALLGQAVRGVSVAMVLPFAVYVPFFVLVLRPAVESPPASGPPYLTVAIALYLIISCIAAVAAWMACPVPPHGVSMVSGSPSSVAYMFGIVLILASDTLISIKDFIVPALSVSGVGSTLGDISVVLGVGHQEDGVKALLWWLEVTILATYYAAQGPIARAACGKAASTR